MLLPGGIQRGELAAFVFYATDCGLWSAGACEVIGELQRAAGAGAYCRAAADSGRDNPPTPLCNCLQSQRQIWLWENVEFAYSHPTPSER